MEGQKPTLPQKVHMAKVYTAGSRQLAIYDHSIYVDIVQEIILAYDGIYCIV